MYFRSIKKTLKKVTFVTFLFFLIVSFAILNFSSNIFAEDNKEPEARISYSLTGTNLVNFSGTESSDEDGSIVSYAWNFGDGATGSGATTSHTYSAPGKYKVILTVTDNGGATDSADKDVEVKNKTPEARISYSLTGTNLVNFSGTESSDEDGSIVSYAWNFGDGATGSGATTSHTYSAPGKYKVILTVTDNGGATDSADKDVEIKVVSIIAPVAIASARFASDNERTLSFNGSGSTDEDGSIVSYAWNFGDGATGSGATTSHTYSAPGKYKVILTVKDNDGASGIAMIAIEIYTEESNIENSIDVISEEEVDVVLAEDFTNSSTNTNTSTENDKSEFTKNIGKTSERLTKSVQKANTSLQGLLKVKKNSYLNEVIEIDINSIDEILDLNKIIENNEIIEVVDLDDIIDLNYESDKSDTETAIKRKDNAADYPQFLKSLWEKIKSFSSLYE